METLRAFIAELGTAPGSILTLVRMIGVFQLLFFPHWPGEATPQTALFPGPLLKKKTHLNKNRQFTWGLLLSLDMNVISFILFVEFLPLAVPWSLTVDIQITLAPEEAKKVKEFFITMILFKIMCSNK